jgi:hypothetical protein
VEGRELLLPGMECEDISGWFVPYELAEEFRNEIAEKDADEIDPKWQQYFMKAIWDNVDGNVTVSFQSNQSKSDSYFYSVDDSNDEEVFENQCSVLEEHIPGLTKGELLNGENGEKIQEFLLDEKHLWLINNYESKNMYMDSEFDLDPYFPLPESFEEEDEEENDEEDQDE